MMLTSDALCVIVGMSLHRERLTNVTTLATVSRQWTGAVRQVWCSVVRDLLEPRGELDDHIGHILQGKYPWPPSVRRPYPFTTYIVMPHKLYCDLAVHVNPCGIIDYINTSVGHTSHRASIRWLPSRPVSMFSDTMIRATYTIDSYRVLKDDNRDDYRDLPSTSVTSSWSADIITRVIPELNGVLLYDR